MRLKKPAACRLGHISATCLNVRPPSLHNSQWPSDGHKMCFRGVKFQSWFSSHRRLLKFAAFSHNSKTHLIRFFSNTPRSSAFQSKMTDLLKDHKFNEFCKVLKVVDQSPSDPDRRVIEKAFRRLALKTHPDKVRSSLTFRDKCIQTALVPQRIHPNLKKILLKSSI